MHVLFLPGWYPNRTHPTLGNFVQRHAEAVATLHDVTVVHTVKDLSLTRAEWTTTTLGRLTEHVLYSPGGPWQRLQALLRRIGQLAVEVRFDVVHGNILHATAAPLVGIHRRWKTPFLVSENWTGYHLDAVRQLPFPVRIAMRMAARRASLLCPVSEQLAGAMRRHGFTAPYTVIPNVVDTDLFHPPAAERPQPAIRFLHVSTLVDAHKNVTGLLNAFAQARQAVPAATLHILGDGDPAPHQATAAGLGLGPEAVRFSGPSEPAEIARSMRESDVFVLPSNHENLPCVMLEAFACGMPVLATAVGGIPEHLSGERGIMIPRGDIDALRDGMLALARGQRRFAPAGIRTYAVDHFSKPVVARAFDAAYHQILQHG